MWRCTVEEEPLKNYFMLIFTLFLFVFMLSVIFCTNFFKIVCIMIKSFLSWWNCCYVKKSPFFSFLVRVDFVSVTTMHLIAAEILLSWTNYINNFCLLLCRMNFSKIRRQPLSKMMLLIIRANQKSCKGSFLFFFWFVPSSYVCVFMLYAFYQAFYCSWYLILF